MRGPHDDQIRKIGGKPKPSSPDYARERLDEFIRERTPSDESPAQTDSVSPAPSTKREPPHRKSRR